ncbi:MAG TPA: hypothetical protein VJ802_14170 [Gemmatimonadaceae bacterium]|nr:hypothetical protein [Gemmatimonadaceae bacterium]
MELPGVLILVITLFGLFAAGVASVVVARRGKTPVARAIALVGAAWLGAYATILIVTSLTSHERTLALGETKRFCGFYLDCHMGVAVERVDTTSAIGGIRAGGTYYVVTLRVSSNARRRPLRLERPDIVIVDAEGFRHERSLDAEHALGQLDGLDRLVEAGASFTRAVVIDVPHDVRDPRLEVTMGGVVERTVELALIGDEDAWLHAPTLHALVPGSGVSSASAGLR